MNRRIAELADAIDRAEAALRAASQALSLLEEAAPEGELCGLLARTLSREADDLEAARELLGPDPEPLGVS